MNRLDDAYSQDQRIAHQQAQRLADLTQKWQAAQAHGQSLSPAEQQELTQLMQIELRGKSDCVRDGFRDR
jgi:hypothetical protein